jgi:hypothetical protein
VEVHLAMFGNAISMQMVFQPSLVRAGYIMEVVDAHLSIRLRSRPSGFQRGMV